MTKNPAEIAGTRYKNEKLMSRMQETDGTSRCFAQSENIKRQSLVTPSGSLSCFSVPVAPSFDAVFTMARKPIVRRIPVRIPRKNDRPLLIVMN